MTMKVKPGLSPNKMNMVKKKINKFQYGSVETLLRWKCELDAVIRENPVTDPRGKFYMEELLLGDNPLNTFQYLRRGVCETFLVRGESPGENNGTFESVLNHFLTHYFPQEYIKTLWVNRKST